VRVAIRVLALGSILLPGMTCLPALVRADVVLAGRLTAPGTNQQLTAGASEASISPDGGYIVFVSTSVNMGQPANGARNVYVYDTVRDQYWLAMSEVGLGGNSYAPSVSEGGGAVAFNSDANNMVSGGTSGVSDLFYSEAFDAGGGQIGFATYLVSKGLGGASPNGASQNASVSADGRYVAFLSYASNLIGNDTNGKPDVFVADASNLFANPPERVSVDNSGGQINGDSFALSPSSISRDGRYVAFSVDTPVSIDGSNAGTLSDVFVRDRVAGTTSLISKSSTGVPGSSSSDMAAISPSGRFVVFRSYSTNLVPSPSGSRVYLRDRQQGITIDMPLPPGANSCEDPRVADTGDIVAQCNMNSSYQQAFLYRVSEGGTLYQLSTSLTDTAGNGTSANYSGISANGMWVVFDSYATDLVPDDTNSSADVFVVVPEPEAVLGGVAAVAALAAAARRRISRRTS
jgi:Tol biopolymer transport system component